jgi:carboxylesterase
MRETHPVIAGAEAWSAAGEGVRARTGIGVIHGFTGNPSSMRALAEGLARRGFTIDMPRLPGHGTHWKDMVDTRYSDWRGEVSRTVDRLRAKCDTVVLVGLSMGGTLVMDIASERQEDVDAVMSINGAFLEDNSLNTKLAPLLALVVPAVPAKLAGLTKNDIAKGGNESAYPKVPLLAAQSLLDAIPAIRARLSKLRIPVVFAYSRNDHSVPNRSSKEALGLVPSTDKKELVLERSFHVATMDYDLELLTDEAAALADRVSGARGRAA